MRLPSHLISAFRRKALRPAAALAALLAFCGAAAAANPLLLNDLAAPTVVGSFQGKRAVWSSAGSVGGTTVDLVATLDRATLNHNFVTNNLRATVQSVGPENIHVTWRLFASGSGYDINTDTGGTLVPADIHVQLNDIDGPNNERAYVPLCDGTVNWVRIDKTATTGRDLGTVDGQSDTFSLIGDKSYNSEPISGLEVLYPGTSTFGFGRTGNNGFVIRMDRPSYGAGQTIDFTCPDFKLPRAAVDDTAVLASSSGTTFDILANDAAAIGYPSGPTEWLRNSVSLVVPSGATNVTTSNGRTTGFTVPEGTWAYDLNTGALAFTPVAGLGHSPTPVQYTLESASKPAGGSASVSAPATVTVTGAVAAADDAPAAPIDGAAGSTSAINVLANDKAGGQALDPAAFQTSTVTPATDPGVSLASDGVVSVAAGTPAGTYAITYKACEKLQPSNCGQATVSVTVARKTITAGADGPYPANGASGGSSLGDAFGNDRLDGSPISTATVSVSEVSNNSNGKITFDAGTGTLTVAAGTPAGPYAIAYRICEKPGTGNCAQATISIQVGSAVITAADDAPPAPVNGRSGSANAVNALGNDTLNGSPVAAGDVNITELPGAAHPGVALNTATGTVSVAAGTPASPQNSPYEITYRICEKLNAANCAEAKVTITVAAAAIVAAGDTPPATDGHAGGTALASAFANDTLDGAPVSASDITATEISNNSAGRVSFAAASGAVTVAAGTPARPPANPYVIRYRICEKLNPANCAEADVAVAVSAAAMTAANDPSPGTVDGFAGDADVINVLANDRLNGAAVDPADVEVTELPGAAHPGVTLNTATGVVSVAQRTPAGDYTISYQVCERLNPANCATASVTVTVGAAPIQAFNDAPPADVKGRSGGTNILDVLANDRLAGTAPAPADVVITVETPASNPKVSLNPQTGFVSVAAGTPAGSYTIIYRIKDKSNPSRYADATVAIAVVPAVVVAADETAAPVSGTDGDSQAANLLHAVTLDGTAAVAAEVTITETPGAPHPGITLDTASGIVKVAPGTPAGTYTIAYQVCETLNPTNCETATVTIPVTAATISAANDRAGPIPGGAGKADAVAVLDNDGLDGAPAVLAKVTLKVLGTAAHAGVVLDTATGIVSVARHTPAGTYTITYRLCEKLNPANCDDATVTVEVTAGTIDAADDTTPPVAGHAGKARLANIFANDTLDGARIDPAAVLATVTRPASHRGVTLDAATGTVAVAPGTPAGTYTIGYRLCEKLNPTNCDDATVSVAVTAAPIAAGGDKPPAVKGSGGSPNLANVLANDTLDGARIDPAAITLTVTKPATHRGVALDPATGILSVAANTPAGTYIVGYRICEKLNPANCAEATATVTVGAAALAAAADKTGAVDGAAGNPKAGNVLDNDRLNGAKPALDAVLLAVITPAAHPGVTLDLASGTVAVAAGTPAGTYVIGYRVCEKLNPANCVEAAATVTVRAARLAANDDRLPVVDGSAGRKDAGRAFGNDRLNGQKLPAGAFTATVTAPAAHPGVAMDAASGRVSVAAGTPAGLYAIGYRLCETLNPANCDDATVSVRVEAARIAASNDVAPKPFDSKDAIPAALDLLANDRLGDAPAGVATVTVSPIGSLPKGFTLSAAGVVAIAEGTASGDYQFGYRICEIVNPENCGTAAVTLQVRKSVPAVSGIVFLDADGDGVFGAGEKRLAGYRVELRRGDKLVMTAVSGADGAYGFVDFPLADGYTVLFIDPDTGTAVGAAAGLDFAKGEVRAGLDQPVEPDGIVYDVSTGTPLAGATLQMQTRSGKPLPERCLLPHQQNQVTGADGIYRFDILFGMASACPAKASEYHIAVTGFPAGTEHAVSASAPPMAGVLDAATCLVDAVRGGACQLSESAEAPPAGQPAPYVLAFRTGPGDAAVVNNHIPLDPAAAVPASGLTITKRAGVSVARRDEAVAYAITLSNDNRRPAGPLEIRDRLPAGFRLIEGSAKVNGRAVEPKISGRTLVFSGLKVPAKGAVEVTLAVRIGADVVPGEHANEAWGAEEGGQALTGVAKATVRVLAEHVFDCGEVIGKVFDDRDRDGAQSEGEKGLPGVRVVTYEGFLITTDAHGRFSVPCAALPDAAIGSNYILKLDTRTLPDGFALTTKNPRTIRLTAGKVSKVNFGATAGRAVAVELSDRAFRRGGAEPTAELRDGLLGLEGVAGEKGARLAVTYRMGGEPEALVKARLNRVRALLERTALPVEIRIVGGE